MNVSKGIIFELFVLMCINITVLWAVMQCNLADGQQLLRGTYCLYFQGRVSHLVLKQRGSKFCQYTDT
jgi:hypothetical protein